jgi:3-deoxy-D-manno-octulosonate 8-phosphate phosphatase (KDO 8-P phosphatase)
MPPIVSPDLRSRAARVELVLMDVDGVLTDGTYYHVPKPDGSLFEVKHFDSQDGIALHWLHRFGIPTGIISGRNSEATTMRVVQGKMKYNYQGNTEKLATWNEILADAGLPPEKVCYLGDDLTDAILLKRAGLAVAVANAKPEVKAVSHYTTVARGGQGALRELTEIILEAKGLWSQILRHYEVEL